MSPLISVIIPAYNAAENVAGALGSIMDQDYDHIEVILVDDGSTDGTVASSMGILDAGGRAYRIIEHRENRGVSCARNTGLRAARGEYVVFMDADDRADGDFISALHGVISEGEGEIALCGFRDRYASGEERARPVVEGPSVAYSAEDMAVMLILGRVATGIWRMMFRRDFLTANGLLFEEGCFAGEDVEFAAKAFSCCRSAAFSPKCPYIYMIHDGMGSIANSATREQRLARYEDNTKAHFRLARYLMERSGSRRISDIARCVLLPMSHARQLNVYARQNDRARFDAAIRSPEVRSALWSSCGAILLKPEVFLKSLLLLAFPGLYFRLRGK
ncbi:MAG: glycosyltransferase [Synergistaceae bacterium]|nr:glycosyltransferase [Synergistaceae bacterium]